MMMTAVALAAQVAAVPQATMTESEFRGLHAASATVVWATGRNGVFTRTADGGVTWHTDTIPGADSLFLVDVHAFDARSACVLATHFNGGDARIYRTGDGGVSWTVAYENHHPSAFVDGLAFWGDTRGVAFGDPIDGAFLIIRSADGCRSWTEVPRTALPTPLEGEAGFAASGTAIGVFGSAHAWIGTGGGRVARVLATIDGGQTWAAYETPMSGGPTAGIFGIAFRDAQHGVAVGGDHTIRTAGERNVIRTGDGGIRWEIVSTAAPAGVRYGLAYAPGTPVLVATGPSGYGYSLDEGSTWVAVDTTSVNTVALSGGRAGWVAGVRGRIWRVELPRRP